MKYEVLWSCWCRSRISLKYHEIHWVTLTFDLACRWAFRWAKVRSKSRLKSKSKVISLSERQTKFMVYVQTYTKVKLNFGLSPDFSVQLKVSLSDSLSERLSQKLKWPIGILLAHCKQTLTTLYADIMKCLLLSDTETADVCSLVLV